MDLAHPLAVVTPNVDGDVLTALAGADTAFTGRGLHRLIKRRSHEGVRRSLERLVEQGIVAAENIGASTVYRLNREHMAAPHIEAIAGLRAELLHRMRRGFDEWKVPAVYAALFGSAARGDMHADSDIDLFIVRTDDIDPDGEAWSSQVDALVRDVARWTGNDVRPLLYSDEEARLAGLAKHGVVADIAREGIRLAGPASYFRQSG